MSSLPRSKNCVGARIGSLVRRGGMRDRNERRPASVLLAGGIVCAVLSIAFAGATGANDKQSRGDPISELRDYIHLIAAPQPDASWNDDQVPPRPAPPASNADPHAALHAFVHPIPLDPRSLTGGQLRLAEADTAFDALREFLQRLNRTTPPEKPNAPPPAAPAPMVSSPATNATLVGSKVCLGCHARQADVFSHTLMGRLLAQGKLDCEACHGPGSAHVHAAGCATCHGAGGITTHPGIPSLVGQDPHYLVGAMKAYQTGQRKNVLMHTAVSGMGEAEFNNIALYYARQVPARAQTPPVGDAAAGRSAAGLCGLCHGEQGVSVSPWFPSLAGQDARYLADAITAYKDGSRSKTVPCAACHGEGGISTRPGIPSLVGQDPQYLVGAMKAYVSGQRKKAVMKAVLTGASDAELNRIALYYGAQSPARAQTALVGNPSAGKQAGAVCVLCHGEQGGSVSPRFPSLAGQDARYLADAIKAYKEGSRSKAVACAACHGEGGISTRPGIPSLAGRTPQYLVTAMKAYMSGQRKNAVMQAVLTGASEADLNRIALYYARQVPARAQTALVGNPSAGKQASTVCAGCHGEEGVSVNAECPSLAGQGAQYLADALRAYKEGTRSNPTMKAMAETLDERTINDIASYFASLRLAQPAPATTVEGQPAQHEPFLVVNGLLASLDERTINDIASYFASLSPAQAASVERQPAQHEPSLVRNGLVASLDERTIDNIASYYASLRPSQPASAIGRPPTSEPSAVRKAAPADRRSLGGIISFRPDDLGRTAEENNAICLSCHLRGERTYWPGSVHETRRVACTECHTLMKTVSAEHQLKTAFEPNTCFQCHKDRRAQIFRSAHMPIREGKIVCSDCHNPHGSATEALLRDDSVNDTCYECHADKRGPFLFEHEPVRENCLSCHDPHGSINQFSLKTSLPRLCYNCHTLGHPPQSGPNTVFTMSRACLNCHTQIHGSNSPAGAVFQR